MMYLITVLGIVGLVGLVVLKTFGMSAGAFVLVPAILIGYSAGWLRARTQEDDSAPIDY